MGITGLANKDTRFLWTEDHESEFQRLKKTVADVSVLSAFDPALPLHLMCDASREGWLGYMLLQPAEGRTNILQCGSSMLTPAQRGYSIVELELLAITWALSKCDYFMRGAPKVVVMMDHASLVGLEKRDLSTVTNGRLVRMLERTRGYSINIVHVKGTRNRFADALSRQPITDGESVPEFPMFAGPCERGERGA